jgi:hypothetical protein
MKDCCIGGASMVEGCERMGGAGAAAGYGWRRPTAAARVGNGSSVGFLADTR